MEKGKYGVSYQFYVTLAVILALFGQVLLCFALFGIVLIGEKHPKTAKQVLQVALLQIFAPMIILFVYMFTIPAMVIGPVMMEIEPMMSALALGLTILPILGCGVLSLGLFVVQIVMLIRAVKGQEIRLPLIIRFVDWSFGVTKASAETDEKSPEDATAQGQAE